MTDRLDQQLGNYRLTRLLGRGGFAEVYLGEHLRLGTQAAVKVLYTRLASKDDAEGFEKEAQTIAHLKHPHIVRVLDFDIEENTPFLVMDYAPGGTLRQRHPKGTVLPLPTIITYVKQVADALQYAHDQRLVHRDIKPENMLVGQRDEVLLSDFGIATIAHHTSSQGAEAMAGTVPYMAPEQVQGKPRSASDQYALGIVVYEWLSGGRPFNGTATEIAMQHVLASVPSLRENGHTTSPEVEQVVMTALAKDYKQRFGSVQAFANALEQAYQAGKESSSAPMLSAKIPVSPLQPTRETPPASLAPTRQTVPDKDLMPSVPVVPASERNAPIPAASFASMPSLLNTTGVPSSPFTPTDTPSVTPSVQPVVPSKRGISRRTVLVGLAGLVVVGSGATWLILSQKPPVETTLYTYRGHSDGVNAVAWSPTGLRIASGSDDNTVQVWDAANGGNVYTYHGHSDIVNAVAWSPTGLRIASGSNDHTVQVWNAVDGSNVYTYSGHADGVTAVAWSPDGKRIASGSNDHTVQVWNATNGGNVYTYRGHANFVRAVAWSTDGRSIASASADKSVQVWQAE